jgi:transcriptional regulator with XRE-family HTH domain
MKFGDILKQILEKHEIKQTKLAENLNVTQPYISNVIKGRTYSFGLDTINKMAKNFNLSEKEKQDLIQAAYNESGTKKSQSLKNLISNTTVPLLDWNKLDKQENIFTLKIKDDSYLPEFTKDDLITVDPKTTPKKGMFVLIKTAKKISIEKYEKTSNNIEIFGIVVSKKKKYI